MLSNIKGALYHCLSGNRSIADLCSARRLIVEERKVHEIVRRRSRGLKEVPPVLRLHNSNSGAAVFWNARDCDAHFSTRSHVMTCS